MYTSEANATLAISIVFPLLAVAFVGLRFAARNVKSVAIKADDWTIVLAVVGFASYMRPVYRLTNLDNMHWAWYQFYLRCRQIGSWLACEENDYGSENLVPEGKPGPIIVFRWS